MLAITLGSATNTFGPAIALSLIDKGALGVVLLIVGYLANRKLEQFKGEASRKSELLKLQATAQMQFLERRLCELYWPLLIKFEKDTSLWRRVPRLSQDDNLLPKDVGNKIEMDYLLPNHLEAVKLIEGKAHLVQDAELIELLQQYIKHVAVYSALRNCESQFNPIDVSEAYPASLPDLLKRKTYRLQKQYDELVGKVQST